MNDSVCLGVTVEYPCLKRISDCFRQSECLNAAEILLDEASYSDFLPLYQFAENLWRQKKRVAFTFVLGNRKKGFFQNPARQTVFLHHLEAFCRDFSGLGNLVGLNFHFPLEELVPAAFPGFCSLVSAICSSFPVSPDLFYFSKRTVKKYLSHTWEEQLFYLDFLRGLQWRRFFLRDFSDLSLAFLSGAGGVFASPEIVCSCGDRLLPFPEKALYLFGSARRTGKAAILFSPDFVQNNEVLPASDVIPAVFSLYRELLLYGVRPDVVPSLGQGDYSVVFSPFCFDFIPAFDFSRMVSFVEKGGVWVSGPFTYARNGGKKSSRSAMERLAEVFVRRVFLSKNSVLGHWNSGEIFEGAFASEGYYRDSDDWASGDDCSYMICRKIGRGSLILLGAMPVGKSRKKLIETAFALGGLRPVSSFPLLCESFSGTEQDGEPLCFDAVYSPGQNGEFFSEGGTIDLLSGKAVFGRRFVEKDRLYLYKKMC